MEQSAASNRGGNNRVNGAMIERRRANKQIVEDENRYLFYVILKD